MGTVNIKTGNYTGAIAYFNKAINLFPKSWQGYDGRGKAKYYLEDFRSAISDLNKAISFSPKIMSYYFRGHARFRLKDYNGALRDYNIVIMNAPKFAEAYFFRATAKGELGQKEAACLDLSKAGELGYTRAYEAIRKACNN